MVASADVAAVLSSYKAGSVLVRFYGSLEYGWMRLTALKPYKWPSVMTERLLSLMPSRDTKSDLAMKTIRQLQSRSSNGIEEMQRMSRAASDEA